MSSAIKLNISSSVCDELLQNFSTDCGSALTCKRLVTLVAVRIFKINVVKCNYGAAGGVVELLHPKHLTLACSFNRQNSVSRIWISTYTSYNDEMKCATFFLLFTALLAEKLMSKLIDPPVFRKFILGFV